MIAEYRGGNDCLQLSTNWCLSLWLHWKSLIKALFHTKECLTKECWKVRLHRTVYSENSIKDTVRIRFPGDLFVCLRLQTGLTDENSYSRFCQGCSLVSWYRYIFLPCTRGKDGSVAWGMKLLKQLLCSKAEIRESVGGGQAFKFYI